MTLVTSCFSISLTPFLIPVVDGDMFIWSLLAKLMLSSMYDAIAHRRCKMQDLVETCWAMLSPVETMCQKTWQRKKQSCCCKTRKIRFDELESLRMIGVCKHLIMLYVVEICWNSFCTFSAFFPLEGVQGRSSVLPDQNSETDPFFFSAKLLARNLLLKLALLSFCRVFKHLIVSPKNHLPYLAPWGVKFIKCGFERSKGDFLSLFHLFDHQSVCNDQTWLLIQEWISHHIPPSLQWCRKAAYSNVESFGCGPAGQKSCRPGLVTCEWALVQVY